ncbi:alpha/beta fold hydrolase [Streptomyces sp. NPDC051018]|uniref:alpha/beta fold hydrolase n=1 Tax=Streptomyces sp. NPDC051018 TaxID=3365639 RepID=UPI00379721C0
MSRPPTFVPPPCARPRTLRTARGDFAVLDAQPEARERDIKGLALLVPGFTGSKEDFIAMLEPLTASGYRVIAVDGRGQYETRGPDDEQAYAQDELARDLLAQAAALNAGVPHPADPENGPGVHNGPAAPGIHLLGHSLGGQIARAAVLLDPSPFRTLTLMSSGPAEISPAQQEKVRMLSDALMVMSMEQVWNAMEALDPPEDADMAGASGRDDLLARWLRHNPVQLITTGRRLTVEPDRVDELTAVRRLPSHVLSGERDDAWPVPLLDDMARRLGALRTVVEGAEHSPNTDRPKETAAAITRFWDKH